MPYLPNVVTFVDRIVGLERMPSSKNGNSRWRVSFAEHASAPTEVDGSVAYGINNSEYRDVDLAVTLNSRGHVAYLRPVIGQKPTGGPR